MDDNEIITATEASRSFSDLLHRVCYGGESFIIKKGSRLMARITPVVVQSEETGQQTANAAAPEITLSELEKAQLAELSAEDAEYFKSVIEQIRKVPA